MKKLLFVITAVLMSIGKLVAQKAWATPDPINPNDSITIWVDIKKCDRQQLAGTLSGGEQQRCSGVPCAEHRSRRPRGGGLAG